MIFSEASPSDAPIGFPSFRPKEFPSMASTVSVSTKKIPSKRWWIIFLLFLAGSVLLTNRVDKWYEMHRRGSAPDLDSGPWGNLQSWTLRLEQPQEYTGFESLENKRSTWHFGTLSPEQVVSLLTQCGITPESAGTIVNKFRVPSQSGVVLQPDEETLVSLSPDVRSRLYRELAKDESNRFQASPYLIPKGDPWLLFNDHRSSDAEAVRLIKQLSFQRNGFTYFSDPEVVFAHLKSPEEQQEFKQALTGESVVLARILIRKDEDIDKAVNYWALSMPGVKIKDIRPLFEAEQSLPDGGSIALVYLLPPLARQKLYTSPLPPEISGQKMPDCHWTALNFFSSNPDPRMADNDFASKYIQDNYYQIAKPGVGGDLVLLLDDSNRVIHSSVYIASDLVFTKNGINYAQPWVLMHEKDMIAHFSSLDPVKVAYFRRKGI
jgi:hypothetical protein